MTARRECLRPYDDGSARKHSICDERAQVTGGVNKALDRTGFIGSSLSASPAQSSRAGNLAGAVSKTATRPFYSETPRGQSREVSSPPVRGGGEGVEQQPPSFGSALAAFIDTYVAPDARLTKPEKWWREENAEAAF